MEGRRSGIIIMLIAHYSTPYYQNHENHGDDAANVGRVEEISAKVINHVKKTRADANATFFFSFLFLWFIFILLDFIIY